MMRTTKNVQPDIKPLLSICIPTYNRAPYLDYLLSQALETWAFSFSYEIIVSDNASPDNTSEIVEKYKNLGLPIRYFRQAENKGAGPNGMNAFHCAVGFYIVFIGDDDLLKVEGLELNLAYLQSNPELLALYAPWELYDAVRQQATGQFYTLQADVTFNPGQQLELLGLIIEQHIFPEHMIYRADTLRVILADAPFCYWAFVFLAHIAARGAVHFSKTPFYRSINTHPVAPSRPQLGVAQAMTDWDTYRGGLEYFIYVLLKSKGQFLNDESSRQIRVLIDGFIEARMRVALRLWLNRNDYVAAYNLVARLNYANPSKTAQIQDLGRIQVLAASQILARFTNSITDVDRLVIVGDQDVVNKRATLVALGLREDIAVGAELATGQSIDHHRSVVVISREDERKHVLDLGYAPGLIISNDEIFAGVRLL